MASTTGLEGTGLGSGHDESRTGKESEDSRPRTSLVQAVKTPLGFFALVVVVMQAILCVSLRDLKQPDSTYLIGGMLVVLIGLVGIVSLLAVRHPDAVGLRSPRSQGIATPPVNDDCVKQLTDPLVICASTSEFEERSRRFERDSKLVKSLSRTKHEVHRGITEQSLRNLFMKKKEITIFHLCASLDDEQKSLRLDGGSSMEVGALIALLTQAKTSLLVLATCDSVEFAARISYRCSIRCNVIASTKPIEDDRFLAWLEGFYTLLGRGHSVCHAYDVARDAANVPIVLLMRQDFRIV
jgi:hypothetical protein